MSRENNHLSIFKNIVDDYISNNLTVEKINLEKIQNFKDEKYFDKLENLIKFLNSFLFKKEEAINIKMNNTLPVLLFNPNTKRYWLINNVIKDSSFFNFIKYTFKYIEVLNFYISMFKENLFKLSSEKLESIGEEVNCIMTALKGKAPKEYYYDFLLDNFSKDEIISVLESVKLIYGKFDFN